MLLAYLGVKHEGDYRDLLVAASAALYRAIQGDLRLRSGRELSMPGRTVGGDTGLLLAKALLIESPSLFWRVSESDELAQFRRPVLATFKGADECDITTIGFNLANRILCGEGSEDDLARVYARCVGAAIRRTQVRRVKADPPVARICPPVGESLVPGSEACSCRP